ncbi:MAG: LLM class flavin-dependent oxidoreductase [Candidatus Bathyarchaeia archaeon]
MNKTLGEIKLKFGITPSPYFWGDFQRFVEWCMKVEEMGFDAILIPDHYQFPVPPFYSNELVDAWTTLSYISAKTSRIKLGSLVSPIPRYIPSQLAKLIANVDLLSKGRVIAGFGVGYSPEEFINYSPTHSFDEPKILFEKFKEGVEIILKLWKEDKVTFKGKYYTLNDAVLLPKPLQRPRPPLWIGGVGRQMLEVAAKFFDCWVPPIVPSRITTLHTLQSTEQYEKRVRIIQEYLKRFRRKISDFTFGALLRFASESDVEREAIDIIERYKKAGSQYFVIEFSPNQIKEYMKLTEKFARGVVPSFR